MNDRPHDLHDSAAPRSLGRLGWLSLLLIGGLLTPAAYFIGEMVSQRNREASAYLQLHVPPGVEIEYDVWKSTLQTLMTHRIVLTAAISKPEIAALPAIKSQAAPISWLQSHLQVTYPGDAEIMKISLSAADRRQNAILVNAVVDAFMSEVVDEETKERQERRNELEAIRKQKSQELEDAISDLRNGTFNEPGGLTPRQKSILDELSRLRGEAIRNQFEWNRTAAELVSYKVVLEMAENDAIPDIECRSEGNQDAFLDVLAEEIVACETEADDKDRSKLENLKTFYAACVDTARDELRETRIRDCRTEIAKREAAIEVFKKQQAPLLEELKRLKKEADRDRSSVDPSMRRTAIANEKKALDEITLELEKLEVDSRTSPRVTILQKAEVPN